jgi:hypothetical protein
MRTDIRNRLVAITVVASAFTSLDAATITLTSQSGGQYTYGILLGANEGLAFIAGNQIVLSGLSGVLDANASSMLGPFFTNVATTPDSVIFTDTTGIVYDPLPSSHTIGTLTVDSSVLTPGPVSFQIQNGSGTSSGTVSGPVAVPEPAELGLASLFGLLAYKYFFKSGCNCA